MLQLNMYHVIQLTISHQLFIIFQLILLNPNIHQMMLKSLLNLMKLSLPLKSMKEMNTLLLILLATLLKAMTLKRCGLLLMVALTLDMRSCSKLYSGSCLLLLLLSSFMSSALDAVVETAPAATLLRAYFQWEAIIVCDLKVIIIFYFIIKIYLNKIILIFFFRYEHK